MRIPSRNGKRSEKLHRSHAVSIDLDNVAFMQIFPFRCACGITLRLRSLRKSCHNAGRHLRIGSLSVQNRFINGIGNGFRNHFQNPRRKLQIRNGIFQNGIAYRHVSGHFVPVQCDLIESKGEFVDFAAHFSPYRFRHGPRDGLTGLSFYGPHPHPV